MAVSSLAHRKRLFNRSTLKGKGLKQFYCLFVELAKSLLSIDVIGLNFNPANSNFVKKCKGILLFLKGRKHEKLYDWARVQCFSMPPAL